MVYEKWWQSEKSGGHFKFKTGILYGVVKARDRRWAAGRRTLPLPSALPRITNFSSSASSSVKQADRRYWCTALGSQAIKSQVYHNKHAIPYRWVTAIIEPMSHGHWFTGFFPGCRNSRCTLIIAVPLFSFFRIYFQKSFDFVRNWCENLRRIRGGKLNICEYIRFLLFLFLSLSLLFCCGVGRMGRHRGRIYE